MTEIDLQISCLPYLALVRVQISNALNSGAALSRADNSFAQSVAHSFYKTLGNSTNKYFIYLSPSFVFKIITIHKCLTGFWPPYRGFGQYTSNIYGGLADFTHRSYRHADCITIFPFIHHKSMCTSVRTNMNEEKGRIIHQLSYLLSQRYKYI